MEMQQQQQPEVCRLLLENVGQMSAIISEGKAEKIRK